MEAENPAGTHCQILYRDNASQLSYGRAFVPVSYDQLRPLFWNGDDEDGIGQAVPELSFSRLSEALKKLSKETKLVNDPAKLKSMLYSSELMNADAVRYSVLPLGESDERRVQRSEEHTSELQSRENLVCRLLLEKKKSKIRREQV